MDFTIADVRRLLRLATMKTGNALVDDDLVQDATLKALVAFRRAGCVEHPRAFLAKIVEDTVRDHWRKRRPVERLEAVPETRLSVTPTLEADMDRFRQAAALRRAVLSLDPAKRRLLELHYDHGFSIAEIAGMQGRGVSAVKMDLLRTRQQLVRLVGENLDKKSRMSR